MRLIERPPRVFRKLFPGALFRIWGEKPVVYLTFDDGPIPESTPEILDMLDRFGAKATFFMVGDNVRKHGELAEEIIRRGHGIGNHTMHHLQGSRTSCEGYMADVAEAAELMDTRLFRPPHGWLKACQLRRLKERYRVVMYDLVTRDYSRYVDAERVVENVKRLTRNGSIIVFHDSLKSIDKLRTALPASLAWLKEQGYGFGLITEDIRQTSPGEGDKRDKR